MQIILILSYVLLGLIFAYLGLRYDVDRRPGQKTATFLFVEFCLVATLWPAALILAAVSVGCLRIAHHLYHKKKGV